MELDNFSWGLIDDSNLDISNTNVNANQHNMDLNDDSDNIGGYNPDKMNLSFDEFSFDLSKKHDTIADDIKTNANDVSDPTLSLPNSFNMSPVTLKSDKPDNKTNILYTPIIKHLHSQLKSLVISDSYYTELKLKAANALTAKANKNGKVVELSLYEEACLRVMEYALPYKNELDVARVALNNAMAGNQSLQANIDLLKEEASRTGRIVKVQQESAQMEISSLQQANEKLQHQLNNELEAYKLLAKSSQQLEFDNNLLKHQIAEHNQVLLDSKLSYQTLVDEKVERELTRLRLESQSELDHMKTLSKEIMERECRLHKDAKEEILVEYTQLKSNYALLQESTSHEKQTLVKSIHDCNIEIADLKSQCKVKTYENTSMSIALENKTSLLNQNILEIDALREENQCIKATLAQLEITYKLNTNHQREQYEALLNKYNAYTALESQLDSYIQNAGVSHGSQDQGRAADGEKSHTDGSNVAPVYDTITNIMELHGNVSNPDSNSPGGTSNGVSKFAYQRRVEHSVKLAKDLLVLQNKYNDLEQKYNNTLHECAITKEMLSEAKIDYERISTCISHSNTNHPDNATITPVGFIVKQLRAVETKYKTLQLDYKQSKAVATTLQDTVHQQEQQIEEYKQQLEQCVAINNELLSMKGQLMHMEAERQRLEKSASQRINEQYRDTDTDSTSSSYDSYDSYSSETISDTHSEPHKERDRNRGRGRKSASNPPSSSSKPPTPSPVGSSFSVTKKSTPGPSPNSDGSNNSDGSAKPASVRSVQHTPNSSNLDSNSKKPPSTPVRSKENSPESNGSNGSSGHRKNMQMTPEQYNAMTRRPSSMDANSSGGGKHKWHVRESI